MIIYLRTTHLKDSYRHANTPGSPAFRRPPLAQVFANEVGYALRNPIEVVLLGSGYVLSEMALLAVSFDVASWQILLQKSAAGDGRSAISLESDQF
jgi:hypothetical protein